MQNKRKSSNNTNQDAYVVVKNFLGYKNYWLFGVFDGHGADGHKVSHYVKRKLPEKIIYKFIELYKISQKTKKEMNHNSDSDEEAPSNLIKLKMTSKLKIYFQHYLKQIRMMHKMSKKIIVQKEPTWINMN